LQWFSPPKSQEFRIGHNIIFKKQGYEDHHLMTNKNDDSTAEKGPYTPRFEELAERRGWDSLDYVDPATGLRPNVVSLQGHQGPHARYNRVIYEIMSSRTDKLSGKQYDAAFDDALAHVRQQTLTLGTRLNRLATGQGDTQ
jgi:hypothetical protein